MRRMMLYAILAGLFVTISAATQAAEPFDPAARAKTIAPFIEEDTDIVVHVDISRINGDALYDKLAELVPKAPPSSFDKQRAVFEKVRTTFVENGFSDVYVLVNLVDIWPRRLPTIILPMNDPSDADALFKAMPELAAVEKDNVRLERLDSALFLGPARAREHARQGKPRDCPELEEAFRAAGDTAVQLLFLPTANERRVIEELLPELPESIGGGPSTILTRGLLWAAVGVNAPPEMSIQLVIQSEDAAAASALREKFLSTIRMLVAYIKPKSASRDYDTVVPRLTTLLDPKVEGDRLTLLLDEQTEGTDKGMNAVFEAVALPMEALAKATAREKGVDNLKWIGLAMHNWHDTYKSFPAQANYDASGKSLLSWRVHILPFIEHRKLYEQFHFDEPWNSEHNKKLIAQMPNIYRSPLSKKGRQGYSSYVVPVHETTAFPGREGIPISEIKDGTVSTIMIVEVADDQAVIWTQPEDLPFDPKNPAQGLGGLHEGGFQVTICDGSVRFISESIDPENLRRLFMRNDGNPVDF